MKTLSKLISYGSAVTVAGLLALALVWSGPISTADAALVGSTPSSAKVVSANGTATVTFTAGTDATLSNRPAVGHLVQFTSSKGTWPNGESTYTTTADSARQAKAKLKSTSIGNAVVTMTNLSDGSNTTISNSNVTFVGTPTWSGKSVKSSLELNTTVAEDDNFFSAVAALANASKTIAATAPTAADALNNAVFVTARVGLVAGADTPGSVLITGTDINGSTQQETLALANTGIAADDDFFDAQADMANGSRGTLTATTPTGAAASGVFVSVTIANDGGADTVGTLALVGTAMDGTAQTETITLAQNATVVGTKVFKTVTTATVASWTAAGNADDMKIGYTQGGIVKTNKPFKSVTSAVVSGWTAAGTADKVVLGYDANRVGVVNNPTAFAYSSSSTLDVDGLSDSKGNLIAGAVVTMTIDGDGTWDNTGTKEVVVVTDANGDITAQGLTVPSGGKSATITTATSGSFGVSSVTTKLKQNGVYATAELTGNSSTTAIIDKLADNEGSTAILRILTKDSGGNKVDSTNTPTVTCAGSTSTGKALIASASVADGTASDGYREVSVDPANASATPAVCTWKIAASGTEPASSGTFNVTVADNAVKTVTVTAGDGSDLTPGVPVTVTATLLDKNGVAIRTGEPAETVTIAINGTSGGNQLINATTRTHKNGVVTATFIPGDKLGNYTITATPSVSTTKVGYAVVKIASATAAEPAVSITGDVSASGSSLVVINGSASGSKIVELTDAKSVWITENGVYKGYVAGAPAFVNADFPVANTGAVIVVK